MATVVNRVCREALENIRRHGDPGGPCQVVVSITESEVRCTFVNAPFNAVHQRAGRSPLGLVGMRERLAALGGSLDVQCEPGHWVTRVVLPPPAQSTSPADPVEVRHA